MKITIALVAGLFAISAFATTTESANPTTRTAKIVKKAKRPAKKHGKKAKKATDTKEAPAPDAATKEAPAPDAVSAVPAEKPAH